MSTTPLDQIAAACTAVCAGGSHLDPRRIFTAAVSLLNGHNDVTPRLFMETAAECAEGFKLDHPDYSKVALRLYMQQLHLRTHGTFSDAMNALYAAAPQRWNKRYIEWIREHAGALDAMIEHERDFDFDGVAWHVLSRTYLQRVNGEVMDRPQYMYMRVAVHLFADTGDFEQLRRTYTRLSLHQYTQATPTMLNACLSGQLASCFLLGTADDIGAIHDTMKDSSIISKNAGGIGIDMSPIRGAGQPLRNGGKASGLIPQLRIYNQHAQTWDQGGIRPGAYSVYLPVHHPDIMAFLSLELKSGDPAARTYNLNTAIWVPDLFVRRLQAREMWSLMSPDVCAGLDDVYDGMRVCARCNWCANPGYNRVFPLAGPLCTDMHSDDGTYTRQHTFTSVAAYTQLYERYEREGKASRVVDAVSVMSAIATAQIDSGKPYVCFKDNVNRQSNHNHVGTIRNSNLCTEIMQYSSADTYSTCVLASVNLPRFVRAGVIDHDELSACVRDVTIALNRVVDTCVYPVDKCNRGLSLRPIGIGIQGLANALAMLGLPFVSDAAAQEDIRVFETIYWSAMDASCDLAAMYGSVIAGSLAAEGILRCDLGDDSPISYTPTRDWAAMRHRVRKYGLRNSLLTTQMPTASTSMLLGNNESIEPFRALVYRNGGINGRFTIAYDCVIRDLIARGLWHGALRDTVVSTGALPVDAPADVSASEYAEVRALYATVWDVSQMYLQRRAAARGKFIDQSQSLNIHIAAPTGSALASLFVNGWRCGLMCGSYYINSKPASNARNALASSSETHTQKKDPVIDTDDAACPIGCDSCSA